MLPSDSEEDGDAHEALDGPSTHIPPTIYVIKFHPNARREAVEWLLEKIEAKQKYGGAELYVRSEPQKQAQGVVVHVSATKIKLLEVAEATELRKKTSSGLVQEFSVRELDQFLYADQTLDTVLTPAEREFCVRHELDGILAKPEDGHIPGYPEIRLYSGHSIIEVMVSEEIITSMYPLHDRPLLNALANQWYKSIFQFAPIDSFSPLMTLLVPNFVLSTLYKEKHSTLGATKRDSCTEEIRSYFGESIATFFAFLGFYTTALVVPACLGVYQLFSSGGSLSDYTFYCALNLLWVAFFLQLWKRRCSAFSYSWGTIGLPDSGTVRLGYHGNMKKNPITGRHEPLYPPWKTKLKIMLVSLPTVVLCVFISLYVMMVAFWAEEHLIDWKRSYGSMAGIFLHLPSAVYAAVVWIMNFYYRRLTDLMTDWENHRTQYDHDWHRVTKLVIFHLFNNFSSLVYIAFYIQDMDMLCSQVATMLIVTLMINHFREALLPYVIKKAYSQYSELVLETLRKHPVTGVLFSPPIRPVHYAPPENYPVPVLSLDPKDPRISQAKEESEMEVYQGAYGNYLDIFLQFGYLFLFCSVYPMGFFWALLSNILEMKRDAFKLWMIYQRPKTERVSGIGVWQGPFELLAVLAVVTNCALLALSPSLKSHAPDVSAPEWFLLFFIFEHLVIGAKVALLFFLPGRPKWVQNAIDKYKYQSKQAIRTERGKKTRRHLSRRFHSVHGMPRSGSRSRGTTPVTQNGGLRQRSPVGNEYASYKNY